MKKVDHLPNNTFFFLGKCHFCDECFKCQAAVWSRNCQVLHSSAEATETETGRRTCLRSHRTPSFGSRLPNFRCCSSLRCGLVLSAGSQGLSAGSFVPKMVMRQWAL